jgi:cobalt-zinc-cadmium efflux system outer membrane protein
MKTNPRSGSRGCQLFLGLLWLAGAGCQNSPTYHSTSCFPSLSEMPAAVSPLDEQTPETHSGPWTLEQLLTLATQNNPELEIARGKAEAARGKMVQAGLYPNPAIHYHADEMNSPANGAGQQGMTIDQLFITGNKLRLAEAAAAQGVAAADWQATTRWFDVMTKVRLAYFELLTALRDIQTNEEAVRIAKESLEVAKELQKAGAGTKPDVLRAQVDLDQNRIRLANAQRRVDAAWRLLAAAVGVPTLGGTTLDGSLEAPAPTYEWQPLVETVLTHSSEVQEAQANILQAEGLLRRAQVENIPNVMVMFRPFYDNSDSTLKFFFDAGITLPIFNRNQGNIQAAKGDVIRTRAEVRAVELRLTERLTAAFQRYQIAREQTEAYRKTIVPNAKTSLDLVREAYKKEDPKYNYTAVLEAQRTLVVAELAYTQSLGELWRAIGEIRGLLQEDELRPAAPPEACPFLTGPKELYRPRRSPLP